MNILINHIIDQYQEIQNGKVWIGQNFQKKFDGVNDDNAFIRPLKSLHSVAELVSHLTTWRKETILKIKTGTGSLTDDCEENWFDNVKLKALGWNKIRIAYESSLDEIIKLLQSKNDDFLSEEYYDTDFKGKYPYSFVINGMLHHDIYHLGQIGIVLKFIHEKR